MTVNWPDWPVPKPVTGVQNWRYVEGGFRHHGWPTRSTEGVVVGAYAQVAPPGKTIVLSWIATSPVKSWTIERYSAGNWVAQVSGISGKLTQYAITGLGANTTYIFSILPVGFNDVVGPRVSFNTVVTAALLSRPATVTMTGNGVDSRSVTVTWDQIVELDSVLAPCTGYFISWGTTATGTGVGSKTIEGTRLTTSDTVTGLTQGQILYFRVAPNNPVGTGAGRASASSITVP